jgi:hypothetical protein
LEIYLCPQTAVNAYSCPEGNMDTLIKIGKNYLTNFSIVII